MEPPTAIETISLSAYLKTIKESKKHLHIRTDMLDELKLAENVEEIDVSVYVEPSTKPKSAGAPDPAGAMCATSLVVKYARRLAGILDSDTRVVNLTDVGRWLQQLSSIAAVKEENIELPDMPRRVSELEKRTADWRMPLSPEIAVMYAQDDLRKRFDMETRTERFMRRRKAELAAAKKLMEEKAKQMAEEEKMRAYLASIDSTANEAELMTYDNPMAKVIGDGEGDGGGSGFDEGDGGGTAYISSARYGGPYGQSEPSSGNGKRKINEFKRKKGNRLVSRGKGRRYGGVTPGVSSSNLFEKEEAEASSEDSECSRASSLSFHGREGGGASSLSYERVRLRSASAHRKFADTYTGISESEEIVRLPREGERNLRSIGVETVCEMVNVILHVFLIERTF
ncbi:hypothetical protein M758_7G073800 [Ceratodon purpureus]|nr:hypothetical protein M758_7G073800 [Ceratodon purpureus]